MEILDRLYRCAQSACILSCAVWGAGCGAAAEKPPNILLVVWDTVRSDHLSLYGYELETTPFVDEWAENARVYENAVSAAGSTVPSHASIFTGLLPSEHGANNDHKFLDDQFATLAECLSKGGYDTYAWAANPHISAVHNFDQGFDRVEHPWDERWIARAQKLLRRKLDPTDSSSELPERIREGSGRSWDVKASGNLAREALGRWLERPKRAAGEKPWFAFINYMEAHRPFIPSRRLRRALMTPEQVAASYTVDRGWESLWSFNFGLHEYSEEELEVMERTYDATLLELDGLFQELLDDLEARGELDNTVIVLTADHGEHLGEHHLLDHQYSLYEGLLRVPLVVHYPRLFEPGRDPQPVSTPDIFPTLLELADQPLPSGGSSRSRSLLQGGSGSLRVAEMLATAGSPLATVRGLHPEFDSTPWERSLRAIYRGDEKLIWASDGRHETFDVSAGGESKLDASAEDVRDQLLAELAGVLSGLKFFEGTGELPTLTAEDRQRLEALGYLGDEDDAPLPKQPTEEPDASSADGKSAGSETGDGDRY